MIYPLVTGFCMSKNFYSFKFTFFSGSCLPVGRYFFFFFHNGKYLVFVFSCFRCGIGQRARLSGRLHIAPGKKTMPGSHDQCLSWFLLPGSMFALPHSRSRFTPSRAIQRSPCCYVLLFVCARRCPRPPGLLYCCFVNLR